MSKAPKKKIVIRAPSPAEYRAYLERVKAETEARRRKAREEILKNAAPGQLIDNEGVFLGQYSPKDHEGNSLGKIFNVFAAPQDLPDTMKYVDAVKHIAKLKGWNGFDGTNYATDKELYAAIKSGSYNGGWIIPTRDILSGKDVKGKVTMPDNLYAHKDKDALVGTFCMAASSGSDFPNWYWSSTEVRNNSSYMHGFCFKSGGENWALINHHRLACRPVRLVPAQPPPVERHL